MYEQSQMPRDPFRSIIHLQVLGQINKTQVRKRTLALKAIAVKGTKQRSLSMLYQSVIHSITEYSLGLTGLSQSNTPGLNRVHNGATRVILGTTKDAPIEAMPYILDLPRCKQDVM